MTSLKIQRKSQIILLVAYTIYSVIRLPRSVMAKVVDDSLVISDLIIQSHYYIHFRTNSPRKDKSLLITLAMG